MMTQRIADLLEGDTGHLPVDTMLRLVDADSVAAGLLLASDVPSEIVTAILARYPDDEGLVEAARGHWNAPVAVKLALPMWRLSGASMTVFFESVQATEAEQVQVSDGIEPAMEQHLAGRETETLGQRWDRIRPLDLS